MRTILRIIMAFTFVAGTAFIIFDKIVMPMYVASGREISLPDVSGQTTQSGPFMTFDEARKELEKNDLVAVEEFVKYTSKYPPGMVLDQYPQARRKVKPGRKVRLTVAKEEKMVKVPNLVGQSLRHAQLKIEEIGLHVDTLLKDYDTRVPLNVVRWQNPIPGNLLRKGSGVKLEVSLGRPPDFYEVPDLVGITLAEAKVVLAKEGLRIGKITRLQDEDKIPDTVLNQSIEAGTILRKSIPIDLTLSFIDISDLRNRLTDQD
ncbi:MAG: PASTA domain-containing protein [Fidelibacterota bacterium]